LVFNCNESFKPLCYLISGHATEDIRPLAEGVVKFTVSTDAHGTSVKRPTPDYSGKSVCETQELFPLVAEHAHGVTIVELSNGDLLAPWFQGSGER
jgi:hypothetical protein